MTQYPDAWTTLRTRPARLLTTLWPWRSLAYLLSTVVVGVAALVVLATVVVLGVATAVVVVGLLLLSSLPLLTSVIAAVEKARLRLVLPRSVPDAADTPGAPTLRERIRAWRTLSVSWPEVGYSVLLAAVLWLIDFVVLAFAVSVPVVLLLAPALMHVDTLEVAGWRIDDTAEAWVATGVGVVAAVLAAYLVTAVASAQAALTSLLLDPTEARLAAAVEQLRRSRTGLVDAFADERRRIERDLHDGAQQRLVALTMTLGQAELELDDGPALELVGKAHALAEDALAELRATVSGFHPQVLTDHGLAAAIQELAGRSPVPVETDLDLNGRLPARVEGAAYFLVSEALTNAARHAKPSSAQVHARVADETLTVSVSDDGRGGADPARGTGLAGLVARVEAVDGAFEISSPPGGPTTLRMTCPTG